MPYIPGASNPSGPYTLGGTQTYQQANNDTTQYVEAVNTFNGNLFTPFVLTGFVATKDGTVASKLDVTTGTAYLTQTDGTLRQRTVSAFNETTATPTTTYYLDLNPDGSLSWGTAHSGVANYLTLCTVTTDASANILSVTDTRQLTTELFLAASGPIAIPAGLTAASVPPVTQVNATNAGSTTTPQVRAATNTGLSTNETTANGRKQLALMPTEGDSTERGLTLGYTDGGGAYHPMVSVDATAALKYLPTGARYGPVSFFSGTGAGTVSHGLGATPSWVGITDSLTNATMTVGVDSIGSSTVHVNTGAGHTWIGVAIL